MLFSKNVHRKVTLDASYRFTKNLQLALSVVFSNKQR